jgi:hypothetical protein
MIVVDISKIARLISVGASPGLDYWDLKPISSLEKHNYIF